MKLSTVKKYKRDFFQALDGFLLMITQVLKHHNHCVISLEEVIQITMGSLKEDQSAPSSKHDDVQTGRILYISENAAEYLGHSMEDLLIHGDRLCHHPHQHKHQHHPQHLYHQPQQMHDSDTNLLQHIRHCGQAGSPHPPPTPSKVSSSSSSSLSSFSPSSISSSPLSSSSQSWWWPGRAMMRAGVSCQSQP